MAKASAYFHLNELPDKHDEKAIKRELDALPGVHSVSVSGDTGRVAVDYDTTGVQAGGVGGQLKNHNPNQEHNTKKAALGPNTKR